MSKRAPESAPERTCVGTRQKRPAHALVRVVVLEDPNGQARLVIDWDGRVPGRGAWLSPAPHAVARAIKSRALTRALTAENVEPLSAEELLSTIRAGLVSRFLGRLGLARRAGAVTDGQSRVAESMAADKARLLVLAADLSEGNRRKYRANAERKNVTVVDFGNAEADAGLHSTALGSAVGRETTTCLAVEREPFVTDLARLAALILESQGVPAGAPSTRERAD